MTDTVSSNRSTSRGFDLKRALATLLRPAQVFEQVREENRASWLTPMLMLSLTALLVVLVSGYLKTQAAMLGEVPLPPDWQWWTPDMQANYMQAQQLTQGKVFMYVIPLVGAWVALWLGWVVLGGLLHLGSTLLGGRGTMQGALTVTAWATLPFAMRDLLRVIFMLGAGHAINSPGLSAFATSSFMVQILSRTDLFFFWSLVLLVIGFAVVDGLPRGKAFVGVALVVLLLLAAQAGIGSALSGLGSGSAIRPF